MYEALSYYILTEIKEEDQLSKMKSPTIPQKKMETLKHRRWTGMSIDPIGPFDKSVEGNH